MSRKIVASLIISFSFLTPLLGSTFNVDNSNNSFSKEKNDYLDINYLKKLPKFDYILGAGDELTIIVSEVYPELISNLIISGEGIINLPTLGRLYVSGLTVRELKDLLDNKYKDYVKYSDVQINIVNYRPIKIFIDGEINEPGILSFEGSSIAPFAKKNVVLPTLPTDQLSQDYLLPKEKSTSFLFPKVFDVIQKSGGITEYSDLKNIRLIRKNSFTNGGGKIETTLNLEKLIFNSDDSHNIRIYDEDILIVGKLETPNQINIFNAIKYRMNPKYVKVLIAGRVNSPGVFTLTRSSSLNDAIDVAGGAKFVRGRIKYISFKNDGSVDKRKISYNKRLKPGSFSNPYLKQGDLIVVGNNLFSNSAEAINEITAPFQGLYSTYRLYELITE